MSLLTRVVQKIFGDTAGSGEFGVIGSKSSGDATTTKDLDLMQSDSNYDLGLNGITNDQGTSRLPYTEDMNSLFYLITTQLKYLFQSGIPEWNIDEDYYSDVSIVIYDGVLWKSTFGEDLTPNTSNEPSSNLDKWVPLTEAGLVIEDLRLFSGITDGQIFELSGYYEKGDVEMPKYVWDSTSSLTDNNNSVIQPTAETGDGRWVWVNQNIVNVLSLGVRADGGTTNNTGLIEAGFGNFDVLYIPPNELGIAVIGLDIPAGKSLIGDGYNSLIIPHDQDDSRIIEVSGDNVTINNIRVKATGGKDSGNTSQNGIYIDSYFNTHISNCFFEGLGGAGFYVQQVTGNHQGNIISDCTATDCNIGFDFEERGEYTKLNNSSIYLCNIGANVRGGNTLIDGCTITNNEIGVKLVNGTNDGHGIVSASLLNHNTVNVRCEAIVKLTHLFSSCMLYAGDIELISCEGIKFVNCDLSTGTVVEDGALNCWFKNCHIITAIVVQENANGNPSEVFWLDSEYAEEISPGGPMGLNGGLLQVSNSSSENYTTGLSHILEWDTIDFNSITNNILYTVKSFYDSVNFAVKAGTYYIRNNAMIMVQSQLSIGRADGTAWDSDSVVVRIKSLSDNEVLGIFSPVYNNSDSAAVHSIPYVFNGQIRRRDFYIEITNNEGADIRLYSDGATPSNNRTYMQVTGW